MHGMISLFRPTKAQREDHHRSLPVAMRQLIVDLKAEYPDFTDGEIAAICAIQFDGRRPSVRGLPDKSHANTSKPGVDLPTRNIIRKKQEENPLLGEFRMYAALKQLGISTSPRTCGRIMAEHRRLYAIKPKPEEPHTPKPHPFKATARHERWDTMPGVV